MKRTQADTVFAPGLNRLNRLNRLALAAVPQSGGDRIQIVKVYEKRRCYKSNQWLRASQDYEIRIDMDHPAWWKTPPMPALEWQIASDFALLQSIYRKRVQAGRVEMLTRERARQQWVNNYTEPNLTGEPGSLQGLPRELRKRILQTCVAGESPRRHLQILHALQSVNHAWLALAGQARVEESLTGYVQRVRLAMYEDGILQVTRDNWSQTIRHSQILDDMRFLCVRHNLPLGAMSDQALSYVSRHPGTQGPLAQCSTLNLGAIGIDLSTADEETAASRAFFLAHGAAVKQLNILKLDSEVGRLALQACTNLSELVLENECMGSEPSLEFLVRLPQLTELSLECKYLDKLDPDVLGRLRKLRLSGESVMPLRSLKDCSALRELELPDGTPEFDHAPWLAVLPDTLTRLTVSGVDNIAGLQLPASLEALDWWMPSNFEQLSLGRVCDLSLGWLSEQCEIDAVARWLKRQAAEARSLKLRGCSVPLRLEMDSSLINSSEVSRYSCELSTNSDRSLAPVFDALSDNCSLQSLHLPTVRWSSGDVASMVKFLGNNDKLIRLRLGWDLTQNSWPQLDALLSAIGKATTLHSLTLLFSLPPDLDVNIEHELGQRFAGLNASCPGLEWGWYAFSYSQSNSSNSRSQAYLKKSERTGDQART